MPKKPLLAVVAGLVLVAMGFLYFYQPGPSRQQIRKLNQGDAKPYEPPFVKEGELTFIDQDTQAPIQKIDIEIVETEAAITQGLMYRRSMAETQGMPFIFDRMEPRSFWMK
ncbi:MAG: DUF192 domain-containing protein, partial [Bacteroidetes bacterium]